MQKQLSISTAYIDIEKNRCYSSFFIHTFINMDVFWSSNTQTDENLETYSLIWPNAFVNTSQENIIKIRRGNMGLFLREP
jgi:hypothetical protein